MIGIVLALANSEKRWGCNDTFLLIGWLVPPFWAECCTNFRQNLDILFLNEPFRDILSYFFEFLCSKSIFSITKKFGYLKLTLFKWNSKNSWDVARGYSQGQHIQILAELMKNSAYKVGISLAKISALNRHFSFKIMIQAILMRSLWSWFGRYTTPLRPQVQIHDTARILRQRLSEIFSRLLITWCNRFETTHISRTLEFD